MDRAGNEWRGCLGSRRPFRGDQRDGALDGPHHEVEVLAHQFVGHGCTGDRPVRINIERSYGGFFHIDIFGSDMASLHRTWLAPAPGIGVFIHGVRPSMGARGYYICRDKPGPAEDPNWPDWVRPGLSHCMEHENALGFRVTMRHTSEVATGLYTLYFDGQPVPFILERGSQRPMQLAIRSCSVMEEIDGPQHGLIFRRSKPAA